MKHGEKLVATVYIREDREEVFRALYHMACMASPQFVDYKAVPARTLAGSFLHAAGVVDAFFARA